jgi:hypothetical protein
MPGKCAVTQKPFTAGCHCPNCERLRYLKRIWKRQHRKSSTRHEEYLRYYGRYGQPNKQKVLEMLGGVCAVCGSKPIHTCQIDLHELNGRIAKREYQWKNDSPSNLLRTRKGYYYIMEHLAEIVPICRNCHGRLNCKVCRAEVRAKIEKWRANRKPL